MNLQKIIIHEIKKEAGTKEADIEFSNRCLDASTERRITLVSALAKSFTGPQNKVSYSGFDHTERFPQLLTEYLENATETNDPSEADFLDFSKKATNELFERIKDSAPAKGGYLVFAEYNRQQQQYIAIFLVRDTQGNIFRPRGDVVDVENITFTDTNKLAMACSINVAKFLEDGKTPLLMINKRTPEVSEYFAKWLGSKDKETSENYTKLLIEVIRNIPPPPQNGKVMSSDEIGKKVYEIAEADYDGHARLDVISKVAFGDEDAIQNHLEKNHIDLPSEFKVYRPSLKKLIEIRLKTDGMMLEFSRSDFHRKVNFGDDNTIIIKSSSLFNELREEFGDE